MRHGVSDTIISNANSWFFLKIIDFFHSFGVIFQGVRERMILKCNLSGNPCCFFLLSGIKAIIRRNDRFLMKNQWFYLGNHRLPVRWVFTSIKIRPIAFSNHRSATLIKITPNQRKIKKFHEKCWFYLGNYRLRHFHWI